jgi:hypothetical protein
MRYASVLPSDRPISSPLLAPFVIFISLKGRCIIIAAETLLHTNINQKLSRMSSSWICCRVDLVRTDVSEECVASIFKVEKLLERRRWRLHVSSKRRFIQDPHCGTSQKTAFFIVTAVKTSDPTEMKSLGTRAGLETENTAIGIRRADHVTHFIRKSWH